MILVVGATGNLGGAVTRMLLAEGQPVRILARSQSNYQPLADAGAQVVLGDLKQRGALDPACEGVDTLITTANSAARGGEDNPQTVDLEGNRNLIDAAKAAGVKQFIFVSVLGADPNSPVPFIQTKGKTEDTLRESGIPYTVLAPNGYMEVMVAMVVGMPAMMGQPVTIVGGGRRKHSFISAGDVAIYEGVLGHQIQVRSVAPGEPVPGLTQMIAQVLAGMDTYDSPIDMTETARTFGIQLTPLEEVARRAATSAASA
jgi:uncharacterized protein YbjT (DUF2867 family)